MNVRIVTTLLRLVTKLSRVQTMQYVTTRLVGKKTATVVQRMRATERES